MGSEVDFLQTFGELLKVKHICAVIIKIIKVKVKEKYFFENFRKIFFQTHIPKNRAKNFGVFKKILEKSEVYFSVQKRFLQKQ